MHVTINDPETGEYVHLCVPRYNRVALVIGLSSHVSERLWDHVRVIAKAQGATLLLDASNSALPAAAELTEDGWKEWPVGIRRLT